MPHYIIRFKDNIGTFDLINKMLRDRIFTYVLVRDANEPTTSLIRKTCNAKAGLEFLDNEIRMARVLSGRSEDSRLLQLVWHGGSRSRPGFGGNASVISYWQRYNLWDIGVLSNELLLFGEAIPASLIVRCARQILAGLMEMHAVSPPAVVVAHRAVRPGCIVANVSVAGQIDFALAGFDQARIVPSDDAQARGDALARDVGDLRLAIEEVENMRRKTAHADRYPNPEVPEPARGELLALCEMPRDEILEGAVATLERLRQMEEQAMGQDAELRDWFRKRLQWMLHESNGWNEDETRRWRFKTPHQAWEWAKTRLSETDDYWCVMIKDGAEVGERHKSMLQGVMSGKDWSRDWEGLWEERMSR